MGRAMLWFCCIFSKSPKLKKRITRSPKYIRQEDALVDELIGRNSDVRLSYDGYAMMDYSHADAIAAASAIAVETAVVTAEAAVEVVRLTRSGRFEFDLPQRAAVLIQSAFRGFLARKALRALRSLVKLQALVRGYIVRKQTAEHMRRMHSLFRAQAHARAIRALAPSSSYSSPLTTHSSLLDSAALELSQFMSGYDHSKWRHEHPHCDEEFLDKTVEVDSAHFGKTLIYEKDLNTYQKLVSYSPDARNLQLLEENYQTSLYTAENSPRNTRLRRRYPENHCSVSNQEFPNYMAYTKSSEAKLRSLSAPKQRTPSDTSNLLKSLSTQESERRVSPSRYK